MIEEVLSSVWPEIKPVFEAVYPCEGVVAIYADGSWEELENAAHKPWECFSLTKRDNARLAVEPPLLLLHSHPNGNAEPSDSDTEGQLAMGCNWGVVAVHGHPIAKIVVRTDYPVIWGSDALRAPLEGRTFHWGIRDCWTLCSDWYALNGHELAAIPRVRQPGHHHTEPRKVDPFSYWPSRLGFEPVDRDDRQHGDLCVMKHGQSFYNHTAVYLGEGQYLEQPETGLSKIRTFHNEEELLARLSVKFWRLP